MRITIVRHGKPDFEWRRYVRGSEFRSLEKAYDSAGIVGNPPKETFNLVDQHKCIVCSDLPRSIQSAKALGANTIHLSSAVFREMNLPYFNQVPIKLPLKHWVVLLRSFWFLGFSKNTESIATAKYRAKKASEQLIDLAAEHSSVLFLGHGIINHYVAKELLKNDWVGPRNPGNKHWEFGTYEYPRT
ncbi:MAG: histidine phosphatase family protein [Candidatus Thiodiazotropha sp. (ex Codakia rugifera)]|nr:histidine phosphatase family protein [Candidatus Thiodiazotropha sp. (ex Codakia rugifera)]